jgi:DNA polymerase-4
MDRSIVFVQVPEFGISVERACRPTLIGRPLVVAPPDSVRTLVQAASREARQAGIRPGMRLTEASRLCRDLGILYPNPPLYARAEAAILRVLNQYTPCIEPGGSGSAYLDVTSTIRLFGSAADIAWKAEREIREELRLPPAAGLAVNKLVSGVAGKQSPPCEFLQVDAGKEQPFLAPLKVHLLPAVDKPTYIRLRELNFQLIRQLTEISHAHLELAFGRKGLVLRRQAKGEDYSPVLPPSSVPHLKKRTELAEDNNDIEILKAELFHLVEEGLSDIRRQERSARKLQIDILYSDLKTARGVRRLLRHANQLSGWYSEAEELFLHILTRRIRVRAIEVRFEDFAADPAAPLGLFEDRESAREVYLTTALDHIRDRFGSESVRFARAG